MQARCDRCSTVFAAAPFGMQQCPSCGSEIAPRTEPVLEATAMALDADAIASAYAAPRTDIAPPRADVPGAEADSTELLPWDRRQDLGLVKAFVETLKLVLGDPLTAFARLHPEKSSGLILYLLLVSPCPAAIAMVLRSFIPQSESDLAQAELTRTVYEGLGLPAFVTNSLVAMSGSPRLHEIPMAIAITVPLTLASLFLFAGWLHGWLRLLGRGKQGFGATFKALVLAYTPSVFGVVPVLGSIVGGLWSLLLIVMGVADAQKTQKRWVVAAMFVVPMLLAVVLAFVLAAVFAFVGARNMRPG